MRNSIWQLKKIKNNTDEAWLETHSPRCAKMVGKNSGYAYGSKSLGSIIIRFV
ncbi:MAG: hypothetical protein JST21_08095 [Bacteroidetes bacterium]|nr:hypothetical protein [Bacteroidota bacterium]